MTQPKAYDPMYGEMYQILTRNKYNAGEWEHCDYAKDKAEKNYLLGEYKLSYKSEPSTEFKVIKLPQKYYKNATQEV